MLYSGSSAIILDLRVGFNPPTQESLFKLKAGSENDCVVWLPDTCRHIAMSEPLLDKFIEQLPVKHNEGPCLLTGYIGGAYRHFEIGRDYIETLNFSVAELYVIAIRGSTGDEALSIKHVVLKIKRNCPLKLLFPDALARDWHHKRKEAWFKKNGYCIRIKKEADDQTRYSLMLEHLNKYFEETFGIMGSYEVKDIRCLALINAPKEDIREQAEISESASKADISKMDTRSFAYRINNSENNYLGYPVIDESNYAETIGIKFPSEIFGVEALNQELREYHLKLVDVVRHMGMVVIKSTA